MLGKPYIPQGKIGIIAGGGKMPGQIIDILARGNLPMFIVAINGAADFQIPRAVAHISCDIGQIGSILTHLKQEQVTEIVLAGKLQRPSFSALKLDSIGVKLLSRITKAKILGDDSVLSVIVKFLEDEGFKVVAPNDILNPLTTPAGIIGSITPSPEDYSDITLGIEIAREIGKLDIGQGVIVERRLVLGIEAVEGTDAMIARCKSLKRESERAGVLVKMKKPGQEVRVDLPTIGTDTVRNVYNANLSGIAIESGNSLIINIDQVRILADELGIFIFGCSI